MAMTIKQMRDQIRSVIDIDSTDVSDTVLDVMLGQGFDTIVFSEKRWPFFETTTTFTTTSGTKDYTLAVMGASVAQGLREVAAIRTDDHVLAYIGRDTAEFSHPLDVSSSGEPWEYSIWNDTVRFYPTPDSNTLTVTVRAIRNPTTFGSGTADDTEPDLPDPFHPILATYGLAKAYLQQEDPLMASQYMQQFQTELDNVARRYADTPAPQPMVANSRTNTRYLAGYGALRYASTGGIVW